MVTVKSGYRTSTGTSPGGNERGIYYGLERFHTNNQPSSVVPPPVAPSETRRDGLYGTARGTWYAIDARMTDGFREMVILSGRALHVRQASGHPSNIAPDLMQYASQTATRIRVARGGRKLGGSGQSKKYTEDIKYPRTAPLEISWKNSMLP